MIEASETIWIKREESGYPSYLAIIMERTWPVSSPLLSPSGKKASQIKPNRAPFNCDALSSQVMSPDSFNPMLPITPSLPFSSPIPHASPQNTVSSMCGPLPSQTRVPSPFSTNARLPVSSPSSRFDSASYQLSHFDRPTHQQPPDTFAPIPNHPVYGVVSRYSDTFGSNFSDNSFLTSSTFSTSIPTLPIVRQAATR